MCKVLCVSASGFYNYLSRKPCKAQQRRRKIAFQIHMVHHEYRQTYGSPRVCVALNMRGIKCSENYVAKLMQQEGIRPKSAKKFRVRTTDSNHALKVAPNILQRNFTQSEPNKAWAGDITYIRTKEGFIYLAVVLDLFSRMIVGWSLGNSLEASLVVDALTMALRRRKPVTPCLFHSDRGSQYAYLYHHNILKNYNLECSMSRKGDCYDNAVVESFFKTLKSDLFPDFVPDTKIQAANFIMNYIENFYNSKRFHSSLDNKSPVQYENDHKS